MSLLPDMPRRFVAGARCPQCQAVDKIVMFRREGVLYQECVGCGHHEEMRFEPGFRELETRVNRTPEERQAEVTVVRLISPEAQKPED